MIWLPNKAQNKIADRHELTNAGKCAKCGRPYKWTVQTLSQFAQVFTDKEDQCNRAYSLFLQYRNGHICPRCIPNEHRNYIARACGTVSYEFDEENLARLGIR